MKEEKKQKIANDFRVENLVKTVSRFFFFSFPFVRSLPSSSYTKIPLRAFLGLCTNHFEDDSFLKWKK